MKLNKQKDIKNKLLFPLYQSDRELNWGSIEE